MAYWTLGQAAKETGKSKSQIHKAIKDGRISSIGKTTSGYQLDPAEVCRVFPLKEQFSELKKEQTGTQENAIDNRLLEQKISFLEQQLRDVKERLETNQTEKERLLQIVERQTLLIEDHSKNRQEALQKPIEQPRGFWARLMNKKT